MRLKVLMVSTFYNKSNVCEYNSNLQEFRLKFVILIAAGLCTWYFLMCNSNRTSHDVTNITWFWTRGRCLGGGAGGAFILSFLDYFHYF